MHFWNFNYSLRSHALTLHHKVETKWVYKACVLYIEGHEVRMDLVLLDMSTFDVIVGMDWLA